MSVAEEEMNQRCEKPERLIRFMTNYLQTSNPECNKSVKLNIGCELDLEDISLRNLSEKTPSDICWAEKEIQESHALSR